MFKAVLVCLFLFASQSCWAETFTCDVSVDAHGGAKIPKYDPWSFLEINSYNKTVIRGDDTWSIWYADESVIKFRGEVYYGVSRSPEVHVRGVFDRKTSEAYLTIVYASIDAPLAGWLTENLRTCKVVALSETVPSPQSVSWASSPAKTVQAILETLAKPSASTTPSLSESIREHGSTWLVMLIIGYLSTKFRTHWRWIWIGFLSMVPELKLVHDYLSFSNSSHIEFGAVYASAGLTLGLVIGLFFRSPPFEIVDAVADETAAAVAGAAVADLDVRAEMDRRQAEARRQSQAEAATASAKNRQQTSGAKLVVSRPWHVVLGCSESDDIDNIRICYLRVVAQYHPDKVASLGQELRNLASRMTVEINSAFQEAAKLRAVSDQTA